MEAVIGILSMKISASKVPMEVSKTAIGLDEACAAIALIDPGRLISAARGWTARPVKPEARRAVGRIARARAAAIIS